MHSRERGPRAQPSRLPAHLICPLVIIGRVPNPTAERRPSRMDIQFVDYDNVRFHLSTEESKTLITLSMGIQCWPDLVKYGAREHLAAEYDGYLLGESETEPEYDVSLRIDLEKIPSGAGECLVLVGLSGPRSFVCSSAWSRSQRIICL
jgi:hypothetical protein